MNGKGDRATQKVSCQGERLTRRSTLANPASLARNRNKQASLRCVGIMRLNRRHASQEGRGDVRGRPARWIARTESGSAPSEAYTPCRLKDYLHSAWVASALVSDAHPPAHSTVRTAMGSVSFPAFALTLLHFPCPAHEPPPDTGTSTCADGLRRYALAFVAVCFLPHGLKPSGSVAGNRETQRFGFFKTRCAPGRQSQA